MKVEEDKNLPVSLQQKRDQLIALLQSFGSCAVAFSGGLDSTVLAKAAFLALGDRAIAITGYSASMASGELEECRQLAQLIGIRHIVLETGELGDPNYRRNGPDRCFYCKSELFSRVGEWAAKLGVSVVVDGTNGDDRFDHRPGSLAARQYQVRSPLAECNLSKAELRLLASRWQLPVSDKPATPCLSSRIAYGEEVTPERLAMIDRAEQFLRSKGFRLMRVRYHRGDMARIEVPIAELMHFVEESFRQELIDELHSIGFKFITLDLEGFRSGSFNVLVPSEQLQTEARMGPRANF